MYTHIHIKPWQKCWQFNTDPSNYCVFLNVAVVKFSCLGIIVLVYKRKGGAERERKTEEGRDGETERDERKSTCLG